MSAAYRIRCFRSNQSVNTHRKRIRAVRLTQNSVRAICVQRIFSKMALHWRKGDELLNKVVIFVCFFEYKKYSRSFIALRLNHWWQMDYSDNVFFYTFLGLDSVNCLAVNGTVTNLPVFILNILNCAFTGLERHGSKWLMTKFSFWGGVTL